MHLPTGGYRRPCILSQPSKPSICVPGYVSVPIHGFGRLRGFKSRSARPHRGSPHRGGDHRAASCAWRCDSPSRRLFERPAVFERGRDPDRPQTVVAEFGGDPGRRRAVADHRIGVRLRQHRAGELGDPQLSVPRISPGSLPSRVPLLRPVPPLQRLRAPPVLRRGRLRSQYRKAKKPTSTAAIVEGRAQTLQSRREQADHA